MDLNKNAFRIVKSLTEDKKGPKGDTGRPGGLAGGPARAAMLTPERRKEIALKANKARWSRKAPK